MNHGVYAHKVQVSKSLYIFYESTPRGKIWFAKVVLSKPHNDKGINCVWLFRFYVLEVGKWKSEFSLPLYVWLENTMWISINNFCINSFRTSFTQFSIFSLVSINFNNSFDLLLPLTISPTILQKLYSIPSTISSTMYPQIFISYQ